MRRLILIKHAAPEVVPELPASRWSLSDQGRRSCKALARKLQPHDPGIFVSSVEPKAHETAEELSRILDRPLTTAPGLEEHHRDEVPYMQTREFVSMMELFFRKLDDPVLGSETGSVAKARFSSALEAVLAEHEHGNVAVVTHGTVLALFAAEKLQQPPFDLWRRMKLPSFLVFMLPDYTVEEVVESVEK